MNRTVDLMFARVTSGQGFTLSVSQGAAHLSAGLGVGEGHSVVKYVSQVGKNNTQSFLPAVLRSLAPCWVTQWGIKIVIIIKEE